jgi:hypothetical protein
MNALSRERVHYSVLREHNLLQRIVICDHTQDHFSGCGSFGWGRRHTRAFTSQLICPAPRAVVHAQLMSRFEDIARDRRSHIA